MGNSLKNKWSEEELGILTDFFKTHEKETHAKGISILLAATPEFKHRTYESILKKAQCLGLVYFKTWTEEEEEELRALYNYMQANRTGVRQIKKFIHLFPKIGNKTTNEIQNRAYQLRINLRKIPWTKEEEDIVEEIYLEYTDSAKTIKLVRAMPHMRNRSAVSIRHKIRQLGIAKEYRRWTKEEIELLESWVGDYSLKEMSAKFKAKGYDRTVGTISQFTSKRGWRNNKDVYSIRDIAIGFGCSYKLISSWINTGKLRVKRTNVGAFTHIRPYHIAEFLREHPYELDGKKIDVPWIVSILDEFRVQIKKEEDE